MAYMGAKIGKWDAQALKRNTNKATTTATTKPTEKKKRCKEKLKMFCLLEHVSESDPFSRITTRFVRVLLWKRIRVPVHSQAIANHPINPTSNRYKCIYGWNDEQTHTQTHYRMSFCVFSIELLENHHHGTYVYGMCAFCSHWQTTKKGNSQFNSILVIIYLFKMSASSLSVSLNAWMVEVLL